MVAKFRSRWASSPWLFILPPLTVFLIFLPVLGYNFVWDDHITFFQAPQYRDPTLLSLTDPFTVPFVYSINYFRPLVVISFMVQLRIFGLDPFEFHLVSLIFHIINTMLVAIAAVLLATRFSGPSANVKTIRLAALLTGLLYGLHPALIEPVAFVSSRFDLMATCFLLLALIADLRLSILWVRVALVALAFLLAALSKEIAVSFALMLPFLHLSMIRTNSSSLRFLVAQSWSRGNIAVYIGIGISGIVYLLLRANVIPNILDLDALPLDQTGGALQHVLLVGLSAFEYARLTLFPFFTVSPVHPVTLPVPISQLNAWLGLGLLSGLVAVSTVLLRQGRSAGWLPVAVIACFLPILGLLPAARPLDAFYAESFLVFPVAIVLLSLLPLILHGLSLIQHTRNSTNAKLVLLVIGFWLLLSLISNIITLPLWKNDITLWSWAEKRTPHNMLVQNNLTSGYLLREEYPQALVHASRARTIDLQSGVAWNNTGLALTSLGKLTEGEVAHRKAVSIDPKRNRYLTSLADNLSKQEKLNEAEIVYRESLSFEAKDTYSRIKLANLLVLQNRKSEAIAEFKRALAELPEGEEKENLRNWLGLYQSKTN